MLLLIYRSFLRVSGDVSCDCIEAGDIHVSFLRVSGDVSNTLQYLAQIERFSPRKRGCFRHASKGVKQAISFLRVSGDVFGMVQMHEAMSQFSLCS